MCHASKLTKVKTKVILILIISVFCQLVCLSTFGAMLFFAFVSHTLGRLIMLYFPFNFPEKGGQPDVLLIHQTVNGLCTFSNLMLPSQPATSVHTSVCLSPESTDGQKAVR